MTEPKKDDELPIDWDDDPDEVQSESTLWGETRINDAIHEANQQQKDPERYIKECKEGIAPTPETEFRTVYQKKESKGFFRRLFGGFRK